MEDRSKIFDSCTYYEDGILKRDNLKANSPERSGSSHGFRSFFILNRHSQLYLKLNNSLRSKDSFVAEPAEIPIFRVPEAAHRLVDGYRITVNKPSFFNST